MQVQHARHDHNTMVGEGGRDTKTQVDKEGSDHGPAPRIDTHLKKSRFPSFARSSVFSLLGAAARREPLDEERLEASLACAFASALELAWSLSLCLAVSLALPSLGLGLGGKAGSGLTVISEALVALVAALAALLSVLVLALVTELSREDGSSLVMISWPARSQETAEPCPLARRFLEIPRGKQAEAGSRRCYTHEDST